MILTTSYTEFADFYLIESQLNQAQNIQKKKKKNTSGKVFGATISCSAICHSWKAFVGTAPLLAITSGPATGKRGTFCFFANFSTVYDSYYLNLNFFEFKKISSLTL